MKKQVISEEIALNELESFASKWIKKPFIKDEMPGDYQAMLKETYSDILCSIMSGNLVIDENQIPVYTLVSPIKNSDGEVSLSSLNFKTRIKPTDQANIAKGLDLKLERFMFTLRCVSHIIGQPLAMIDNFEKHDFEVISSIATVFI